MIEVVREEDRRGGFEEFEGLIEKQLQLLEGVEKDGVIGVVRQGQAEEIGQERGKKEVVLAIWARNWKSFGNLAHFCISNMCKLQMCANV